MGHKTETIHFKAQISVIQKAYDITFNPDTGDVGKSIGDIPAMDISNLDW